MGRYIFRLIGLAGFLYSLYIFFYIKVFPTPDKIIVTLTFLFMIIGQATAMLKRILPFALMLLAYDSFRSLTPYLNDRVNFMFMPWADRLLTGGELPTKILQNLWWDGQVKWYDFAFYFSYMLHFVLPFVLALFIWKKRENFYWIYVAAFVGVSFLGFLTFAAFPAAPPWMASDLGLIETVQRISSNVFWAIGIEDFVSIYNKLSPNLVAAVPSLHASYAVLFAVYITRLWKSPLRLLSWIYPAMIFVGTVYMADHYVIDLVIGAVYSAIAYYSAPYVVTFFYRLGRALFKFRVVGGLVHFIKGLRHRITG